MSDGSDSRPLVLLVEDSDTIRDAFGILLEESGFRVAAAATGAAGMEEASRLLPDVILMDLGLPDIHGLEVTRRLKRAPRTREIVIVALTGRSLDADAAACKEAGCAAYLAKPVDSAKLLETLRRVLPS